MLTINEILDDFRGYAQYDDSIELSVNSRTAQGETALHWMATLGDHVAIDLLVKAGADVNATDNEGNTPTHEAVLTRQATAVAALMAAGADLCIRNSAGNTALDIAVADRYPPTIEAFKSTNR